MRKGEGGGRREKSPYFPFSLTYCTYICEPDLSIIVDLQPDFRRVPESTRTVVGEPVRLHCQGPKGQPEAEITWRKNGVPIAWDDELSLDKER